MLSRLALVIPCFNEATALPVVIPRLLELLNYLVLQQKIAADSFIYFVDDGSSDDTWNLIVRCYQENKKVKGLKLSRNFGHQNALLSGLLQVKDKADCVITMDADLQDDIKILEQFITQYQQGFEIVYAVRKQRATDTVFKKYSARLFYWLMQKMGAKLIPNHADYRLVSKRVIEKLAEFNEQSLFLRGLFPLLGFKSCEIYYERAERIAGETKYSLARMFAFAVSGITAFSVTPLRLIALIGILCIILSWVFFFNNPILLAVYFIGGIQLLSLGVVGEYIGKIYQQTQNRPRFIIEDELV